MSLSVQVKPDTVEEVRELTASMLSRNIISVKELRTYTGKCTSIASVIFTWGPFLAPFFWEQLPQAAHLQVVHRKDACGRSKFANRSCGLVRF